MITTRNQDKKKTKGRPTVLALQATTGRAAEARRLSKTVTVKFFDKRSDFVGYSKIDYETLKTRSRKANRRLAEYIRESALKSEVVQPRTEADLKEYRTLVGMANRSNSVRLQGKNLNQLTRLSHQTSLYHTSRKVDEALDKVLAIISEYKQGKERNG